MDTPAGLAARLANLGLPDPALADEDEELALAIRAFQRKHDIEPNGEAHEATRAKLFTGWNIAVARVHVIAQAGANRVCVPVKLTNPDGKELVFLSGRCAADVMAYVQQHDQHVFDAEVLRSLPDDYELIEFGQAFAAVSGSWDERDLDEQCALYATTLGIASAPETPSSWASGPYHSEEALIHLLRHRLSDIVRSALGGGRLVQRPASAGASRPARPSRCLSLSSL